jgi:hypothetical protein
MTFCYGLVFLMWCDPQSPPPAITVCPPLTQWSVDYQERLAGEVDRLPKGTAIGEALREHLRLREQLRRCKKVP